MLPRSMEAPIGVDWVTTCFGILNASSMGCVDWSDEIWRRSMSENRGGEQVRGAIRLVVR